MGGAPVFRSLALFALTLVLAAPTVASVEPGEAAVIAGPGGWVTGYVTPAVALVEGDPLAFVNGDVLRHNVVATESGPDDNPWCAGFPTGGCPLFWSALVGVATETPVLGVEALDSGSFEYYCTLHPNMRGTLVIAPGI